jgi:hypothetical protein
MLRVVNSFVRTCHQVLLNNRITGTHHSLNHSDKFAIQKTLGEVKNSMFGYNTGIIRE